MASFVKSKLKAARDAIGKKDYTLACDAASQVLDYEAENYNANVFLGLALLELGEHEKSEQAYRRAIEAQPDQILARQGLSKFYERTGQWDKYAQSLQALMDHFSRSHDATKTAETLQKFIEFRRAEGSTAQIIEALSLLLPESPYHSSLSTLPAPDLTNPTATTTSTIQIAIHNSLPILEEIIELSEKIENSVIQKEVEKRRTRLGAAGPEEVRKEVGREVWGSSKLPHLYDEILNHPNTPDDLRRETEKKLLRHKQRYLHALPSTGKLAAMKVQIAAELDSLVNGVVILRIPDELAWSIFVEGRNTDTIEGYDMASLRQFIRLFPALSLTKLLKAYFLYIGAPLPKEDASEDGSESEEEPAVVNEEDPFDIILDAFTTLSDSIIAHRIVADLYLLETDYQNAIRVAESGIELVRKSENNNAIALYQVKKAFNVILATSLVHFFPPKHHPRALGIIEEVFTQDADNVACLMARAYVLQYAERWTDAGTLFAKVAQLLPDDPDVGLRAKEEHAWCTFQEGDGDAGMVGLKSVLDVLEGLEEQEEDKARCLWRLGKCHWALNDEHRDEAYKLFISALKSNPAYAPAFTSLGIYYTEHMSPPDPIRASKCFQKAFELDPREAYAARRLAEGFSEEREWDLVEVVARRTIDGEGGLSAGLQDSGRYLPTNAWAWKAVGVVELVRSLPSQSEYLLIIRDIQTRRNYAPAIIAIQIALRAEPEDSLSWLRLGEAYSKAGRHAAAIKALGKAHELSPDDWICIFFIGEVHSQIGRYQEAIDAFKSILANRPGEIGVLMSLAQTHFDLGRDESSTGFFARAEQSFGDSAQVAIRIIKDTTGFRGMAWKIIADAMFSLSKHPAFNDAQGVRSLLAQVAALATTKVSEKIAGLISLPDLSDGAPLGGLQALEVAIVAYDYRISLGSTEDVALGSSCYDLSVALHSWTEMSLAQDKHEAIHKQVVSLLTKALRQEPGNDTYWNALGNVNFVNQPKTAQHAYIKALEIDHKNVITWTNLGLLYLYHNDLQVANEALYRAQVLDPDYTPAWAGQGLVAAANGHDTDAKAIFEHAVSLAADVPQLDLEYASRVFKLLARTAYGQKPSYDHVFPAFCVLDRYSKQRPEDATGLHLFALVCECLGQIELSVELLQRAISVLEALYEETEDPVVELQFTMANSNLARLKLSAHDYDGAIESFESALGLLGEDSVSATDVILRAQAHFGSGLAQFKLGNLEDALALFETALQSAGENILVKGQITVMIAQAMWAIGTEDFKESAKAQLLECITADPENLTAINALAGMGILTEDDNLVDAALSELLSLPLERRQELDPKRDVNYLMIKHHLGQGETVKAYAVAQQAIHHEPSLPQPKIALASLALQAGQHNTAMALIESQHEDNLVDTRDSMGLRIVAESLAGSTSDAVKGAQRAVMLTPWELRNWQTLALATARRQDEGREE